MVALEAAAGGKLLNVVVDNEKVSKELLSNHCCYYNVTFIPLNKIQAQVPPAEFIRFITESS